MTKKAKRRKRKHDVDKPSGIRTMDFVVTNANRPLPKSATLAKPPPFSTR